MTFTNTLIVIGQIFDVLMALIFVIALSTGVFHWWIKILIPQSQKNRKESRKLNTVISGVPMVKLKQDIRENKNNIIEDLQGVKK